MDSGVHIAREKGEMMDKSDKLGALWVGENEYGKYFTGNVEIDGQKYSVFVKPNKFKSENPKAPDWIVWKARKREG